MITPNLPKPNLPEQWIQAKWPAPDNIVAFTTTRHDLGLQQANATQPKTTDAPQAEGYRSFNLATHVGDDATRVAHCRQALAQQTGLAPERLFWLNQVHGTDLDVITLASDPTIPDADASMTRESGHGCVVMTADCLPVLLCNGSGTQVAAAHAGWRGLADGVLGSTLATFDQTDDVMAWLGPAISQSYFEVGEDVYQRFCLRHKQAAQAFKPGQQEGKWFADLYQLARIELESLGLSAIYGGEHCTFAEQEAFYSYRRDGAVSGRMASLIYMR